MLALALACAGSLAGASGAAADPAGRTTLEQTIRTGPGPFRLLRAGPGEPYLVRAAAGARASARRAARRRSMLFFAQLTDPQTADEMSPARVEFVDPAGGAISAAHRPQEALGPWVFDRTVRNLNANPVSRVRGARGARARLRFAIATGDMADNQQRNEVGWFRDILEGGRVDPFSGRAVSASNPCSSATPAQRATLDAGVAARRYTGVQDYSDYDVPQRWGGFWDPDTAPPSAYFRLYPAFPRYPGLLDRAQRPFTAQGLRLPWYVSRGNHDGLVQGNAPASNALFRTIVTSCLKVYPTLAVDPLQFRGQSTGDLFRKLSDPAFIASLLGGAGLTPPDPARAFVSKPEYKRLVGGADRRHGFGYVSAGQQRASDGTASYYAFSPRPGWRFIGLDSVAEGGGANGNLDDPQYRWLARELDRSSAVSYGPGGRLVRDRDPNRLIVVFMHHTLETMDNPTPDEDAGCRNPDEPGCDGDPRSSRPIHLGVKGRSPVRDLLLRYPNVVAAVVGHTHHNAIAPELRRGPGRGGFWEVNTASHVDWPQQSRTVEVMDNRDGTLSIFGTILDQSAPIAAPRAGTSRFSDSQLASISRVLAANDPQSRYDTDGGGSGTRRDRNVEMLLPDPRRLLVRRHRAHRRFDPCAAAAARARAAC